MDRLKVLETFLSVAFVLLLIAYFTRFKVLYPIVLGLLFIVLILPSLAVVLSQAWWNLAKFLGKINGGIILSLVFAVVLIPLSFLFRLFNKNKSWQAFPKNSKSNFVERNHNYIAKDIEHPW